MTGAFATLTVEEGVQSTSAEVNGFTVSELRFPAGYVQGVFEPERPYLAVVLDGALEKSFSTRTMGLSGACALTMPAGAKHGARFGAAGARIVIVMPKHRESGCFDRLDEVRGRELGWLAARLAGELRATDAAAPLAAEGYALELVAATMRGADAEQPRSRTPTWLSEAEELLRTRNGDSVGLTELADAVNVHRAHLARAFRLRFGMSVGEYSRRVRLESAAAELTRTEVPIALVAAHAGFSDQSHFTRMFRRYLGTTPARYREATRVPT